MFWISYCLMPIFLFWSVHLRGVVTTHSFHTFPFSLLLLLKYEKREPRNLMLFRNVSRSKNKSLEKYGNCKEVIGKRRKAKKDRKQWLEMRLFHATWRINVPDCVVSRRSCDWSCFTTRSQVPLFDVFFAIGESLLRRYWPAYYEGPLSPSP